MQRSRAAASYFSTFPKRILQNTKPKVYRYPPQYLKSTVAIASASIAGLTYISYQQFSSSTGPTESTSIRTEMSAANNNMSEPPLAAKDRTFPDHKYFIEVCPGFWNCRSKFVVKSLVNISSHMSLCRLENGAFVAIDVIDLAQMPPEAKKELDEITGHGAKLVAVVNTHSFHTMGIKPFHAQYPGIPGTRLWYGCPRHLREINADANNNEIAWEGGNLENDEVRAALEPELSLRIPVGAEFNDPKPPDANHFSNVFVLHRASKCVHNDDCLMFIESTQRFGKLAAGLLWLGGVKANTLTFHLSYKKALVDPLAFRAWLQCLLNEWDFDHLCTAHNGNCFGDAKKRIRELLEKKDKELENLAEKRAEGKMEDSKWSEGAWGGCEECECG